MNPRLVAIAQGSGVIFAGCVASVLAKLSLREVPPFTFVWLQIAIGGALLSFYTFVVRRERIPRGLGREVWTYIALLGVGNFTLARVLFMISLERLPATTHVYLVNFVVIVTMLLSVVMLREYPSLLQILGAILAIAGLTLFFDAIPEPRELTGVVLVGIGVLALAMTNNIARKLSIVTRGELSNIVVSTLAMWIGGIPVIVAGLVAARPTAELELRHLGIIALNGVVSIAVGLTVWNHILRTLRSYEASVLAASSVIYVALLALPVLGESLALHQIAGMATMAAGLVLAQVRRGILPKSFGRSAGS